MRIDGAPQMPLKRDRSLFGGAVCINVPAKYAKWHDAIIVRARLRSLDCYSEMHHINPRSLGGLDSPENLVQLTYREHFLVHWLLVKLTVGPEKRKMVAALHAMTLPLREAGRIVTGWRVDVAKRARKNEIIARRTAMRLAEVEHQRRLAEIASQRQEAERSAISTWATFKDQKPLRRDGGGKFMRARKRRRPRPSKSARERAKLLRAFAEL